LGQRVKPEVAKPNEVKPLKNKQCHKIISFLESISSLQTSAS
jgi:hypothetical protein